MRDRLDARDWIALKVLGGCAWRGLRCGDLERTWQVLGYYGGPAMIPVVMSVSSMLSRFGDAIFAPPLDPQSRSCAVLLRLLALPDGAPMPPLLEEELLRVKSQAAAHPACAAVDSGTLATPVSTLLAEGLTALKRKSGAG